MSPLSSHQRRPNEIPVSAEPAHVVPVIDQSLKKGFHAKGTE
jgi:hypothetical protein